MTVVGNEIMDTGIYGIAGMAKNTGKTTALAGLVTAAKERVVILGVTSIGYDGEQWDTITRLPKPRVFLHEGTWVTTAEQLIEPGYVEALDRTGIHTSLGEIILGRMKTAGFIVLAGPSRGEQVSKCFQLLREAGAELVLVDGALNRMAPFAETHGLILATGAARGTNDSILAEEMAAINTIFQLPENAVPPSEQPDMAFVEVDGQNSAYWESGSFLTKNQAESFIYFLNRIPVQDILRIHIPGVVCPDGLELLANMAERRNQRVDVIFSDPVRILVSGDPVNTAGKIEKLRQIAHVGVKRNIPLLAVTSNPFYPFYNGREYESRYIDGQRLREKLQRSISSPVFDMYADGPFELFDILMSNGRNRVGSGRLVTA